MLTRGLIAASMLLAACGDDDDGPDAAAIDAAMPDASAIIDAAAPDAPGPCPGQVRFEGDYVDWDSTDEAFVGVCSADVVEIGNKANAVETPPNGRTDMCVGADADVRFSGGAAGNCTDDLMLTLLFATDADVAAAGAFTAHGLTAARADTLVVTELGLGSRDATDAIVIVDLGASGGTVDIDATYEQAFVLTGGERTLFANVDVAGGTTGVTVTPPAGTACDGRATVPLAADAITYAPYLCE